MEEKSTSEQFINLTSDNIDKEHLCCAISDKKHQVGVATKKNWLRERIAEGHTFRKLDEKGKGYAKSLIEYCINDAKSKGKEGVCVLSSKKKKPFLTDKKFLLKYGFEVIDTVKDEYETNHLLNETFLKKKFQL